MQAYSTRPYHRWEHLLYVRSIRPSKAILSEMVFPPKAAGSWFLLPPSQAEVRQRGLRWLPGTLAVEAEGEAEIRRTGIAALSESGYGTSYLASTNQLGIMAPYARPDPEAR